MATYVLPEESEEEAATPPETTPGVPAIGQPVPFVEPDPGGGTGPVPSFADEPTTPAPGRARLPGEAETILDMFRKQQERTEEHYQESRKELEPLYEDYQRTSARTEREREAMGPLQLKAQPTPPKRNFGNDMFAFLQDASVLALVGSVLGRKHITNALTSFSNAMDGFKQGKLDQAKIDLEDWKAASDKVINDNNMMLKQYDAILKSQKLDLDQKMNQIQIVATKWQDQIRYDAASTKKITELGRSLEVLRWHNMQFDKWTNTLDLQRQRFLATQKAKEGHGPIPPETARFIGEQLLEGNYKALIGWGRGAQGPDNLIAIQNAAKDVAIERGWNTEQIVKHQQVVQARMAGLRRTYVMEANLDAAADEVRNTAPAALEAVKGLKRGNLLSWNIANQAFEAQTQDPKLEDASAKIFAVAQAFATVARRGSGTSESARKDASEMLSTLKSPEAIEAKLNSIVWEADVVIRSTEQSRERLLSGDVPRATKPPLPGVRPPGVPVGVKKDPPPGVTIHYNKDTGQSGYVDENGKWQILE